MRIEKDNTIKTVAGLLAVFFSLMFGGLAMSIYKKPSEVNAEKAWIILPIFFMLGVGCFLIATFYKNKKAEDRWYRSISEKIKTGENKWILSKNNDGTFDVKVTDSLISTTNDVQRLCSTGQIQNMEAVEKILKFL